MVWPINSLLCQIELILAVLLHRVKCVNISHSLRLSVSINLRDPLPTNDALDALNVFVVQV